MLPITAPTADPSPATCAAVLEQHVAEWRAAVAAEDRLLGRTSWLTRLAPDGPLAVTDPGPLAVPAGFARLGPRGTPLLAAATGEAALRWVAPEAHLRALGAHVRCLEHEAALCWELDSTLAHVGLLAGGVATAFALELAVMLIAVGSEGRGAVDGPLVAMVVGLGSAGLAALVPSIWALQRPTEARRAAAVLACRQKRLDALEAAARRREATAAACVQAAAALPLSASALP